MTAVPPIVFTPKGPAAPAQSAILAGVTADYVAAFGAGLNTDSTVPAGQLIITETAVIGDNYDQQVVLYNDFNPAFATGRALDAISNIYFLQRNPAQATAVTGVCIGLAGTVIPQFSLIRDTNGNLYASTGAATIPIGGSVSIQFQCTVTGPTACPIGAIVTTPYQTIPGWDSVSNPTAGVIGNNAETDYAFRARRAASVAVNSIATNDAILANVLSVPNVIDAYVIDNPTNASVTIGGQTIAAYSLYIGVSGGNSLAVAQAIWSKKPPGTPMTGSTSVTVYDPNPLYSSPPAYTIKFQVLANLEIYFAVSITNSAAVPSNALALIQGAILQSFSGGDGGSRARTGTTLYALRYYNNIAALGAWAQDLVSIQLGSTSTVGAVIATSHIAGVILTVGSVSSGTVAIGQFVTGTGVSDGTYIISGAGSTWTVSIPQTVASTTLTLIAVTAADLTMQINQEPVLDVNDISLTLV